MKFVCVDGKFFNEDEPHLYVSNRGYRYGEGFFETMRMQNGQINLIELHEQRINHSLHLLDFKLPALTNWPTIKNIIVQLCKKNQCIELGRIRLSFYGGNGGINEVPASCNYIIEAWPLAIEKGINVNGLTLGWHREIKKSCDPFSNIKSANFLPYVMAAKLAKQQKWNDCLVMNYHDRIADATIANLFIVKESTIITPSLSEGCIDGIMRRYLLNQLTYHPGFEILESTLSVNDLLEADEIFLTNSISGIKWVKEFDGKKYHNVITLQVYTLFIQPLFKQ